MNTPHKHAEVIKAWADGKAIQWKHMGPWCDFDSPKFGPWNNPNIEWRVKPEKKTGWIAIYSTKTKNGAQTSYFYDNLDNLKDNLKRALVPYTIVQIEYTEGEGL